MAKYIKKLKKEVKKEQMNNLPIMAKEKNKNIFQQIRLSLYKKTKTLSFEKYKKLPDYIKKDRDIMIKVLMNNRLSDDELLQMPAREMADIYARSKNQLNYYRQQHNNKKYLESEGFDEYIEYHKKIDEKFKFRPKTKLSFLKERTIIIKRRR